MNPHEFLVNSEDTGRFIVKSLVTGRTYYVEPIDDGSHIDWGDLNPATKKLNQKYRNEQQTKKKNKTRYRRWPAALKEKSLHIKGLTFFTTGQRKLIKLIKEIDYE